MPKMTKTAAQVTALAKSWVGQKITDPTNPYGGQCTTLINQLLKQSSDGFNVNYTNAKDILGKLAAQGIPVIYNDAGNPNLIPKEGDILVYWWGTGDDFGHVAYCVSADIHGTHTVEQNIDGWRDDNNDGINDQLQIDGGGYTRNNYRDYTGIVGWARPVYQTDTSKTNVIKEKELEEMILVLECKEGFTDRFKVSHETGRLIILNMCRGVWYKVNAGQYEQIKSSYKHVTGKTLTKYGQYSKSQRLHETLIDAYRLKHV